MTLLPFYGWDRCEVICFSPLKQGSPNLSFQGWKYILKIETWSSVMINNFFVIFLKRWQCILLLLYCTWSPFKIDLIFSTLSRDYLYIGAIKGYYFRSFKVL